MDVPLRKCVAAARHLTRKMLSSAVDQEQHMCDSRVCALQRDGMCYVCMNSGRFHQCGESPDTCPYTVLRGGNAESVHGGQESARCLISAAVFAYRPLVVDGAYAGAEEREEEERRTWRKHKWQQGLTCGALETDIADMVGESLEYARDGADRHAGRKGASTPGATAAVACSPVQELAARKRAEHARQYSVVEEHLLCTGEHELRKRLRMANEYEQERTARKARNVLKSSVESYRVHNYSPCLMTLLTAEAQATHDMEERIAARARVTVSDVRAMRKIVRTRLQHIWPLLVKQRRESTQPKDGRPPAGGEPRGSPHTFKFFLAAVTTAYRCGTGFDIYADGRRQWIISPVPLLHLVLPQERDVMLSDYFDVDPAVRRSGEALARENFQQLSNSKFQSRFSNYLEKALRAGEIDYELMQREAASLQELEQIADDYLRRRPDARDVFDAENSKADLYDPSGARPLKARRTEA